VALQTKKLQTSFGRSRLEDYVKEYALDLQQTLYEPKSFHNHMRKYKALTTSVHA